MQDRYTIYGIFLFLICIVWHIWKQEEEIKLLREAITQQQRQVDKQTEVIEAQREYIIFLETDWLKNRLVHPDNQKNNPLHRQI
jgi:hypothetical protein